MDVEIVREWLGHVEADLDAAWSCVRGPRASPTRAAYLVQQAAEKLVKAVLIDCEEPGPTPADVDAWIAEIEAVKADFERWLEGRG